MGRNRMGFNYHSDGKVQKEDFAITAKVKRLNYQYNGVRRRLLEKLAERKKENIKKVK